MKVKFKNDWFASQGMITKDGRVFRGQLYKKNTVVEIPSEFKKQLPKTAVILDEEDAVVKPVVKQPTLRDFDGERAAAEEYARIQNDVDKKLKKA